ncbi:MAG: coproporphyrinogen-III oxidase family protein, partial [Terriglobales bacterium]
LSSQMLAAFAGCGVNRVSLGVQSFVDAEAAAVGRLHSRAVVLEDLVWLRASGLTNINLDLLAGLPHQTHESWRQSLQVALATGAPHLSVYMLEVDEDSRLGRELMAGGTRYHAHFVPDADRIAGFYETACQALEAAGLVQYEISNFARPGFESRHNLKYWTRQPYLGFGVDAHSMLYAAGSGGAAVEGRDSVRLATADSLEDFLAGKPLGITPVGKRAALEEMFFLGLRLNQGVDLDRIAMIHGEAAVAGFTETIRELAALNLLAIEGRRVRLTTTGRLLSNEVFERFLPAAA